MRWLFALFPLVVPVMAVAQGFSADGEAYVWRQGDTYVRFEQGRWAAGLADGKTIRFHVFLWHDAWIYETLQGGTIEAGPALQPDGSLSMAGTFSARENSAPVRYSLRATPGPAGVHVEFEFAKTAPLKLTGGILLHIFADRADFRGTERVWGDPTWHGVLAVSPGGAAKRLLIELRDGLSLSLAPGGFRSLSSEGSPTSYVLRQSLVGADFPADAPVKATLDISFAPMPDSFPGEVKPMQEPLRIGSVRPSADRVPRYEKLELTVDLGATYSNPYDPDQVALDAEFTAPSGRKTTVPGFFMVEHRREVTDGHEVMVPEGSGTWKVRFAPSETGRYTWSLRLRDRSGEISGGEGAFTCVQGPSKGFIRVSRADPHYLAFDSGEGYFAIGHNLPGYHTSGQLAEEAMRKYAAAGENFNRWWMYSYQLGIEWSDKLGWYRQDAAARLDQALAWGHDLGIYYMLCMDTHQDYREGGWERNPFNAKNGGPCANAGEWFTNEQARALYRKRLRYTVARWGYSPNVLAWEFGNEFEGWADSPDEIKLPWHREMSDYLAGIDPYRHLITTSFWSHTGPPAYWRLPNIDVVQTHLYTNDNRNVAEWVRELSLKQFRDWDKPHIFGEFGIRSHTTTEDKDPEGWGIHNALWAGLTSFCAGGPMPWWHENYIDPLNLYFHFTALANFTADLPLGTAKWRPLEVEVRFADPNRSPETLDATIATLQRWGRAEETEFRVLEDGTVAGGKRPQQLLHGSGHEDLRTPVVFDVEYPQAGQFVVHVKTVSNSGLLRVWVDGEQKAEWDLPCGEGLGGSSVWREQWNLWETTYDRPFSLDIPAGRHTIRIENFGKDWVAVDSYTFTGCQVRRTPNVLACGMQTTDLVVLWLQNRDSDWYNHTGGGTLVPVDETVVTLNGLVGETWEMEQWETWKGTRTRRAQVPSGDGAIELQLPTLKTDVAFKLRRVR